MADQEVSRKLAVIVHADVVCSTALVQRDETLAHKRINAAFQRFSSIVQEYSGTVHEIRGDALVAEFARASDAVCAALSFQQSNTEHNTQFGDDLVPVLRVGIALGEEVFADDTVTGPGVVLAQRVEQLSEPGGVCVTSAIHEAIPQRMPFDQESLGEQAVKGFDEPVRVYRVALKSGAAVPAAETSTQAQSPSQTRRLIVAFAAVALVVAGGVVFWLKPWVPEEEAASVARMALPLPDKPSIAVLPFDNLSDNPEQGYFADGLTDDLITDLSKVPGLFVIARNSTFTYKGKPTKVQQVAEELGVRYVVEGSVRRNGDRLRINAQLIDATSGHHIWAERFDGAFSEIFTFQDMVLVQIVANLASELADGPPSQVTGVDTEVAQAYDVFLQGWEQFRRGTLEGVKASITHFEKAIELDPGFSRAYAALARSYWSMATWGWAWDLAVGSEFARNYDQAIKNLDKALEEPSSLAYSVLANILIRYGRHEEALARIDQAFDLDPNDADHHISKAKILNAVGRAEEAEQSVRMAMRLNPQYEPDYLRALAHTLFFQQRYQEAAELMERVIAWQPDIVDDHSTLAAVYGHLGAIEDAARGVKRYNELMSQSNYTPLSVQEIGFWWYGDIFNYDDTYRARLREGLRKAGVWEGAGAPERYTEYKSLISRMGGDIETSGTFEIEGATKIDLATARALHKRGAVFVDVRDAGSYNIGHIPGAVHLDLNIDLTEENLLKVVDKDSEIVFFCFGKFCPWSPYACAKAITWGFTRVNYLPGGFPAWENEGYPVEKASTDT